MCKCDVCAYSLSCLAVSPWVRQFYLLGVYHFFGSKCTNVSKRLFKMRTTSLSLGHWFWENLHSPYSLSKLQMLKVFLNFTKSSNVFLDYLCEHCTLRRSYRGSVVVSSGKQTHHGDEKGDHAVIALRGVPRPSHSIVQGTTSNRTTPGRWVQRMVAEGIEALREQGARFIVGKSNARAGIST